MRVVLHLALTEQPSWDVSPPPQPQAAAAATSPEAQQPPCVGAADAVVATALIAAALDGGFFAMVGSSGCTNAQVSVVVPVTIDDGCGAPPSRRHSGSGGAAVFATLSAVVGRDQEGRDGPTATSSPPTTGGEDAAAASPLYAVRAEVSVRSAESLSLLVEVLCQRFVDGAEAWHTAAAAAAAPARSV